MRKIIFNIIVQIIVIALIFYNYKELITKEIVTVFFDLKVFYILIYLSIPKILIIFSFNYILSILSNKKLQSIRIGEIILTGGLINHILPGAGFIYKYAKLKKINHITIPQYAVAQSLWSLKSLSAYAIFAIIGGTILITIGKNTIYILLTLCFLLIIIIKFRSKIIKYLSFLSINFKFISNLVETLSILHKNIINLLKIYIVFVFLVLIESYGFFLVLDYFSDESLDIIKTSYVFIMSSLTTIFLAVNYFGVFAAVSSVSSNLIMPEATNIFIYAFLFNILNIISMILVISILTLLIIIKKPK
tara:strand:- start:195 stop:1106 length:912 start_codon:yes stop_codon:yes gene_type:complete